MIDHEKVRLGRIIRVKNKDPKPNANRWYNSVWLEDADKKKMLVFLTDNELKRGLERTKRNPEDRTKRSWWVKLFESLRS